MRVFRTSTTPLRPGRFLILSLSSSSTRPNNLPDSWTSNEMSAQKSNAVPSAGLIVVVENVDKGLVGREEAVELMT